ncbi:MAG: CARDB domain-containing protein [Armatimonadota bacterium]
MLRRICILLPVLIAATCPCSSAAGLPDAAIARLAVKGANLREGDRVQLEVELANRGDAPLPPAPVILSVDDKPFTEWTPPAVLAPGTSALWSFAWVTQRGSHLIMAAADPLNDVAESDETNNSAFINVGVEEAREASPWPAAATGLGAFLVGFALAAVARRTLPRSEGGARRVDGRQQGRRKPPGQG